MQHWHVYIKWNERLYEEMYAAYKAGRSDKDPSEGWYRGELWFFDNYVIPLSRKRKLVKVAWGGREEYLLGAVVVLRFCTSFGSHSTVYAIQSWNAKSLLRRGMNSCKWRKKTAANGK